MATVGSAEQPGNAASAGARSRPGSSRLDPRPGAGRGAAAAGDASPRPDEAKKKCAACAEPQPGGSVPPSGRPACPLCATRSSGGEERLRRRTDPARSSSSRPRRRDCDSRREFFVCPALVSKSAEVSANAKRKGVLSDSENEEPISRRIRNVSAFVRKTKTSSALTSGSQRSRSCTDPVEDQGGKLKALPPPAMMDRVRHTDICRTLDDATLLPNEPVSSCGGHLAKVGISHSFTAGILLSSENSRSVSAPVTAPDRRLAWRGTAPPPSSSTPLGPERSVSPESNDSISEELNHFKPIVCSPCTPPKRLPDGRLMEPTIVKSTPRNLIRGLQKATSYEASPAVLQKWRQIELDRQSLKVNSKATLTSPVGELQDAAKAPQASAGDGVASANKRKLLFEPPTGDADGFQKQAVKIRVPAIRYSGEAAFRGSSDFEPAGGAPESCGGGGGATLFGCKRSFSPYTKTSGFQSCKLVPKDSHSPRKESDNQNQNQSTSRRGQKRNQKTKHLDPDRDPDLRRGQIQQDRALALKLQRQFDLENQNQTGAHRRSPDTYFLRSWRSNQNRKRRGLRRSRRINKKR